MEREEILDRTGEGGGRALLRGFPERPSVSIVAGDSEGSGVIGGCSDSDKECWVVVISMVVTGGKEGSDRVARSRFLRRFLRALLLPVESWPR